VAGPPRLGLYGILDAALRARATDRVKRCQIIGQRAKVYPKPSKGYENGETPAVYRSVQGQSGVGGDKTIQEIAAKHRMHPNWVSTWKRQAVERMADVFYVFSHGGKPEGPTEAEVEEFHAKIGGLAVEIDFLPEGPRR